MPWRSGPSPRRHGDRHRARDRPVRICRSSGAVPSAGNPRNVLAVERLCRPGRVRSGRCASVGRGVGPELGARSRHRWCGARRAGRIPVRSDAGPCVAGRPLLYVRVRERRRSRCVVSQLRASRVMPAACIHRGSTRSSLAARPVAIRNRVVRSQPARREWAWRLQAGADGPRPRRLCLGSTAAGRVRRPGPVRAPQVPQPGSP